MVSLKLFCFLLVVGLVVAAPFAEAELNCNQVVSTVIPCLDYLINGGDTTRACCDGVRTLNNIAGTPPDRRAVCRCLQLAASNIRGINPDRVAGLPDKCEVRVPYKFSPSTDCSRVQ